MPDVRRTAAFVLSGCGHLDGSEIHESVLSLLFMERAGFKARCFAPEREQFHVLDHATGEATGEVRNQRTEAARIARGRVDALSTLDMTQFDALVLPGGYGAAKNLSDLAIQGPTAVVDPDLVRVLADALKSGKPVLALCIAPAVVGVALASLGGPAVELTVGNDPELAALLRQLGHTHVDVDVASCHVDRRHKLVSTPAYMLGDGPASIAAGIEAGVRAVVKLIEDA